jgi:hypothetical protein
MRFLFLNKNKPVTLVNAFSDEKYPAFSRFVNGWFCKICDGVTEHEKMDGAQVCCVCRTSKVSLLHSAQYFEHLRFLSAIHFYSVKIEFEAIASEVCENRNVSWWLMVKGQLSSHKKYDEAIKMHELRKQQNLEAGRC